MHSIKQRSLVSIGANVIKTLIGLISGVLLARALEPAGYGQLLFVLGTFISIRGLIDLGASNAFFTFLCSNSQSRTFYLSYLFWLFFQFTTVFFFLILISKSSLFEKIWLGQSHEIVILAFLAIFLQQQVLQTFIYIGDSIRKTIATQSVVLISNAGYLTLLAAMFYLEEVSIRAVLIAMILQSVCAIIALILFLKKQNLSYVDSKVGALDIFIKFRSYCYPLIFLSLITFIYEFLDRWMLQLYGGAVQQGFFQISNQFTGAILLATTSIINIYWKEVAQSFKDGNLNRVEVLYKKTTKCFVMLTSIICAIFVPWTQQLTEMLFGPLYADAWPVLMLMLLYPIHLSLGVVGGSTLLALQQTRSHMYISVSAMTISLPFTYVLLAPTTHWGLGAGAIGLAIKLISINVIATNIQGWVISKKINCEFEWKFQVIGIPLIILFSFISKNLIDKITYIQSNTFEEIIYKIILSTLLYCFLVMYFIWLFPSLLGTNKPEILAFFKRFKKND